MTAHDDRPVSGLGDDLPRGTGPGQSPVGYAVETATGREPVSTSGVELIAAERTRQIRVEGWTPEHDMTHDADVLAIAAVCYALPDEHRTYAMDREAPEGWPWDPSTWRPRRDDRVRELKKAGALIAAEIDRLTGHRDTAPRHFIGVLDSGLRVTMTVSDTTWAGPPRPVPASQTGEPMLGQLGAGDALLYPVSEAVAAEWQVDDPPRRRAVDVAELEGVLREALDDADGPAVADHAGTATYLAAYLDAGDYQVRTDWDRDTAPATTTETTP